MDQFLVRIGWAGAERRMLAADASFRHYARVRYNDTVAVLMDAPPPWEDVRPFQSITAQLAQFGLSAPTIIAADPDEGFLLLEDLGDQSFTKLLKANPEKEHDIYLAATDALISLNLASRAHIASLNAALKPYDDSVYLREAALFAEWFLPQVAGIERARVLREQYLAIWRDILARAGLKQNVLVHRDYHADNLFWLEGRQGHLAVGMIDYQDALLGDPAYDLVSLLEDARRDVSVQTVADCFARFTTGIGEPSRLFADRFAILAAQRNAKIIGIFTRLAVRDGKTHYIDYLPRVWRHFTHDLSHVLLEPLRMFVDAEVPEKFRGIFEADVTLGGIAA